MLCACSGEQFRFEEAPQSPESLATRDFSASGLSSRTGEWNSKLDDIQVDEAESTLKEALSLNYEEARALLGRLEFQRGNFDAALQVFRGIDITGLTPRMIKAVVERTRLRNPRSKCDIVLSSVMSMHSVSLLLEAILLKAKSLEELGHYREAAMECRIILDIVESALPNGMPKGTGGVCKLQDMFHKALELLPHLWIQAGHLDEAISGYRRALVKPWNLEPQQIASIEKELAVILLYGGIEASSNDNMEEAILLLLILTEKMVLEEIIWDFEVMDHLSYALSVIERFELLANQVEQANPSIYTRVERWYLLALCYSAAGRNEAALNLLKMALGCSEARHEAHVPSLLLGAKLCSLDPKHSSSGIDFAYKMIGSAQSRTEHLLGQAHKFLGICYGNAARISTSDAQRVILQKQSLASLNYAASGEEDYPETIFNLGLENAVQRNLELAFERTIKYTGMAGGTSVKGWRLLALILSAQQRINDAETIVEFALDEAGGIDKLQLLQFRGVLQIAQEHPKQAIETYSNLLALIQAQKVIRAKNPDQVQTFSSQILLEKTLEAEAWQDLANIYTKLGSWHDADTCLEKANSIEFYSPKGWHATGLFFEARSMHKEALVSFSLSLSIEPNYVPSIVATARVLMTLGTESLSIARSFLMSALRLEPTNHEAWMNLGLVAKMEGLSIQAAECFQAAYELKLSAPVQSFI